MAGFGSPRRPKTATSAATSDSASGGPNEDLTLHPAYQLGVQHAYSGVAANPFGADRDFLGESVPGGAAATLPRVPGAAATTAASGGAPALPSDRVGRTVAGGARYARPAATPAGTGDTTGNAAQTYIDAAKPVLDQQARKLAGVSEADWSARKSGNPDPFTNGFFKSAADRQADMQGAADSRVAAGKNVVRQTLASQGRDASGNYLNTLPRVQVAGPGSAPVGGTQAVISPTATPPARPNNGGTLAPNGTVNFGDRVTVFPRGNSDGSQTTFLPSGGSATVGGANDQQPQVAGVPRARQQTAVATTRSPQDFFQR